MREIFPPITLTESDYDFLSNRLLAPSRVMSEAVTFLEHELDRAAVIPDDRLPEITAAIGSTVTYTDLTRGRERTVVLVNPEDADIDRNRISVLSPVGVALIGLSEGQVIAWKTWSGAERMLMVNRVAAPHRA
jgi:regulator of nucleoside diphosphate kinase